VIRGEVGSTYVVRRTDVGHKISARVIVTRPGFEKLLARAVMSGAILG